MNSTSFVKFICSTYCVKSPLWPDKTQNQHCQQFIKDAKKNICNYSLFTDFLIRKYECNGEQ